MNHPYTRLFVLPAPPDADNDITEGYELGDVVHVTGGGVYDCRDATEGAAVWEERAGGGGDHDHDADYSPLGHVHATAFIFDDDEGNSSDLGTAPSDGTSDFAARRNHRHKGFDDSEGDPAALGTAADGTSAFAARRDHVHPLPPSGTYMPTLTNVANITSSSAPNPFMYIRIGNFVIGSGRLVVAHDGSGDGQVRFTLPIASDLAITDDLQGNATNPAAVRACSILPDLTNNEGILFIDQNVGTVGLGWRIVFMYEIK